MESLSNQELLDSWGSEVDLDERDAIFEELKRRRLVPAGGDTVGWEAEAGLYPETDDPEFIEKLLTKQEFAENFQESFGTQQREGANPCDSQEEFELTPVQRFISRYLSPQCPYTSALLFHGVGVGKTCAAITTAERFLEAYPHTPVYIVAPRTIQSGFRRTIYDENALKLGQTDAEPNELRGCTGSSYIRRAGVEFERDKALISRRVGQAINARYRIMGYKQFDNHVRGLLDKIPKTLSRERREQEEIRVLRQHFSAGFLIVDEAHNLRDSPGETEDVDAAGAVELTESAEGKALTPTLLKILRSAEGMKLMLLTGTPMYNSYREIIFLMNLMLLNDKKATLSEADIFKPDGTFREGGAQRLGAVASAYISFMRGENPLTFPVRLAPEGVPKLAAWPTEAPNGEPVADAETVGPLLMRLPFVPVAYEGDELNLTRTAANQLVDTGGLGVRSIDEMVQMGNWLFPGAALEARIRDTGFDTVFTEQKVGTALQFTVNTEDRGMWMEKSVLKKASPKAALILNRIVKAKGVIFIYSRFIKAGVLPLALTLEANGYSAHGRPPLLVGGAVDGKGRQCALCDGREKMHIGRGHKFTPAHYVLLTGQAQYSPNNAVAIAAARSGENAAGGAVKVVLGSQVASEGIDLRFVRELYMYDSWFHLNKMEQVLGRGVRTCSHSALPAIQRNCTIHLLVNTYGPEAAEETADLYMYRNAMLKALQVGRVTRVLKRYALDCNLNRSAVLADDLDPLESQEDSQGGLRENIPLNDTPFSSICDWMECPYTCAKPVDVQAILDEDRVDMSTYDEYAMRWRDVQVKQMLRAIFEKEDMPMIQIDALIDTMRSAKIPEMAIRTILSEVVGNTSFRIRVGGQEGYLVYRNTYYVFQPIRLADVRIPLAMRVADVPVRKDFYDPVPIVMEAAPAAAKAPGAVAAATPAPAPAPAAKSDTAQDYWSACVAWATTIEAGTSEADIPIDVVRVIERRYSDDEFKREYNILVMISWMYEDIQRNPTYAEEKRLPWRKVLAQVLLEMVWDGSFSNTEQLALLREPANTDVLARVAAQQRVKKGSTEAFRFVVPTTGALEYICADGAKCSDAVMRLFEGDKADPMNNVRADRTTTGRLYGMMLPKLKEGAIVFKTNDRPVEPGSKPEKGGECEIVSNIETHKKGLREIRDMLVGLGYPQFLLRDEVLDEKKARTKPEDGAKKKKGGPVTAVTKLQIDARKFQNVVKACTLKNIMLRMLDILEAGKAGSKYYFFRPVAAIKAGHKLK